MNLKNKVILITGSSSGIGEATAYKLAEAGAKIVVNCLENVKGAEKVVAKCKSLGVEAFYVKADVSNEKDVDNMFKQVLEKFGSLDVLINNAGSTDKVPFKDAKIKDWVEVFNNNLFGTMLCSQKAIEVMKKGKVLNTASIRGLEHGGREGIMAYSAAKAGVISFTKTLAKLVSPDIQVNAVAPGFVYTPNYEKTDDKLKKEFIAGTLLKRWIDVAEIADGFKYLAETDALTGEVLVIDAGWSMKF